MAYLSFLGIHGCLNHIQDTPPNPPSPKFAVSSFTLQRAAQILERDEDLLWDLSDQLDPEDGVLWILDIDARDILAFTPQGIETLREIIADQINKAG